MSRLQLGEATDAGLPMYQYRNWGNGAMSPLASLFEMKALRLCGLFMEGR